MGSLLATPPGEYECLTVARAGVLIRNSTGVLRRPDKTISRVSCGKTFQKAHWLRAPYAWALPTRVLTEAVADHTFALLLAAARRIPACDRYCKSSEYVTYQNMLLVGRPVHGQTIGIVGMGRIGVEVARRVSCPSLFAHPMRPARSLLGCLGKMPHSRGARPHTSDTCTNW